MSELVVIKLDTHGVEKWRYPARLLELRSNAVVIEAFFNREDTEVAGMVIPSNARFVEIYFSDRWFNIYEMYTPGGALLGWYCNICQPAEISTERISYVDLALDLLVYPDGRQIVLDEDEFEALQPDAGLRDQAQRALTELRGLFDVPVTYRVV